MLPENIPVFEAPETGLTNQALLMDLEV